MKETIKRKKETRNAIRADLKILYNVPEFGNAPVTVSEIESKTGISWEQIEKIMFQGPLVPRAIKEGNMEVFKRLLDLKIKEFEHKEQELSKELDKNSWKHNPNPWIIKLGGGALILLIVYLLGKFGP